MLRPRIIPVLQIMGQGLYKTVEFKHPSYVGDPLIAVKIFNDKEVDEILVVDLNATRGANKPRFDYLKQLASESFVPLAYGGGVSTLKEVETLIKIGFEKVVFNSSLKNGFDLVTASANLIGSQSVVVSIDYKKKLFGKKEVYFNAGTTSSGMTPVEFALKAEAAGAGELIVQSIEKDGTQKGYDVDTISEIAAAVKIPVVGCGGAANYQNCIDVIKDGHASAAAAGALFVYQGKFKAVLINYPQRKWIQQQLGY